MYKELKAVVRCKITNDDIVVVSRWHTVGACEGNYERKLLFSQSLMDYMYSM